MKRYLCSHWALNPDDARWVKTMGFSGLRFDVPWCAPKEYIRKAFDTMASLRLEVLAIVGGWMRWDPIKKAPTPRKHFAPPSQAVGIEGKRVASILLKSDMPPNLASFEFGNEPDLSEWKSPQEFASFCRLGAQGIWEAIPTAKVVVGGVSNIDRKKGAKYLDAVCSAGIDARMIIGIHPYRSDRTPHEPPAGWKSIHDVFKWLRSKGRPIWVTECGWHTSPQKRHSGPFGWCSKNVRWGDLDVAEFAHQEMALWGDMAEVYCWYQMNSGDDPNNPEDNFGIRYYDMRPKPVAEAFQNMWEVA